MLDVGAVEEWAAVVPVGVSLDKSTLYAVIESRAGDTEQLRGLGGIVSSPIGDIGTDGYHGLIVLGERE